MLKKEKFICFAEDWGVHPTSTQHFFKQFLGDNYVVWVNSVSVRSPQFNLRDTGRIIKKLKDWLRQPQLAKTRNLQIFSPLVFPYYQHKFIRDVNRMILSANLKKFINRGDKPILWISIPTAVDMVGRLGEKLSIYYCGDEFSEYPGVNKKAIIEMENEILAKVDIVIVSSRELYQAKRRFNKHHTYLVSHGVDFMHFQKAQNSIHTVPREIQHIKHPVVGYYGHFAQWVDVELLEFLAAERPEYSFVLIGEKFVDLSRLAELNNVYLLGPRNYAQLPDYVRIFDAAVIPFKVNKLTEYVNPLKLLEYFAAGKPVVATELPEYQRFSGLLKIAASRGEFLTHLDNVLKDPPKDIIAQGCSAAKSETWQQKANEISKIIEERMKS